MGIQGLLPLLKSIMAPIHVKDLNGCSVAVDTYSWLHKGALSCSKDLCTAQPTSKHINYCMHRVNLLRHNGVTPLLVFDGGLLPMKTDQENKRARSRKESLARALEHESCGNSAAAYECYQKAVDISPSIAYDLIQVLKQENVSYVVAPYEADAQMTFLAVSKQVDAVITEDSDLIAFGCPRIIYKMDKFGQGVEFQYSKLQQNKELNFTDFTKQMLLEMCILSGCDYLPSLPGMGLKKAHALVKKFKSYDKVIKHLKYNGIAVPPLYEESFKKAILTFRHQRVYDPVKEDIVHLSDPCGNVGEDLDFVGPSIPQPIAKGIASGDLDPFTKFPVQGECDTTGLILDGNFQLKSLKHEGERRKLDLPAQKNLLTNYFCFASLEAKRKFRVPRITPKNPSSKNETPSPGDVINEEDNSCKIIISPVILPSSRNLGTVSIIKDSVDDGVAEKEFVFSESSSHGLHDKEYFLVDMKTSLQQSRNSIHPCIELRKGSLCNSELGDGESITKNKNVILRSSYFQQKSMNVNDQGNNKEKLSVKEGVSTGTCESTISECEYKPATEAVEGEMGIEDRNIIMSRVYYQRKTMKGNDLGTLLKEGSVPDTYRSTIFESTMSGCEYKSASETGEGETGIKDRNIITSHSYFERKTMKGNDQDTVLIKDNSAPDTHRGTIFERGCKSALDAGQAKTRVENKRVIVRSSYFQHKSSKENDQDSKNEQISTKNGVSSGSDYFENRIMKRKFALIDSVETENLNHKCMRTNGPIPIQSNCTSNLDDSTMETDAEPEKFGCNISHLGQYSDIAEKSMEKFVSVISSFRCSSGSRASGLRAPLKDVQNTCTTRSTTSMDLSKFAYVPTNRKASSASRRL